MGRRSYSFEVVLPLRFIYKAYFYKSITECLIQKTKLGYSKLYEEVKDKLHSNISHRDFSAHVKQMVNENILYKEDPTKIRGTPVYYSLTKKAIKEDQLKILGIDEKVQKRKSLYQLLIFFEAFKRRDLLSERQLDRFLRQIGVSQKNLEEIKTSNTGIPRNTVFKPIKGIEIVKLIQSDSKMDSQAASYYTVIPGFTIKEFYLYLKKLNKGKDPRPFSSHLAITNIPFVSYIDYREGEVADAIHSFKIDGLIKPINEVFHGEMRFNIADQSLRNFLDAVWLIHDIDFRLLLERLVYNDKPTDEDKKYLALLFGKKNADKILAQAYHTRKSHKKGNNSHKEKKIAKDFMQDLTNYRRLRVQDIITEYEKVIKENEVASELMEGICFSPFISQISKAG
jgi:hypothetical protein